MVTILVIDDDSEIRYALQALFELQGWKCVCCADMRAGLASFSAHPPDIVLIDYHLPGMSGLEGVRRLRQISNSIPILVFTIDESQSVADSFLEAGASDFAIKPIKAPDLISRIKLHIRLLEGQNRNKAEAKEALPAKGISPSTLQLIRDTMQANGDFQTVDEISGDTNLAYQTTYRYLQFMAVEEQVEVKMTYGRIGRPKQLYRLR